MHARSINTFASSGMTHNTLSGKIKIIIIIIIVKIVIRNINNTEKTQCPSCVVLSIETNES